MSGHYHHLHHHATCLCEFGKIEIERKRAANEKRREFYKTDVERVKNWYREIAKPRDELIEKVMANKPGTNLAEMEKELRVRYIW